MSSWNSRLQMSHSQLARNAAHTYTCIRASTATPTAEGTLSPCCSFYGCGGIETVLS
jgi:hypothetical protein